MRSTSEIIAAIKDSEPVDYEELRMACLVLDSLLFFAHGNLRRLLAGGLGAELTKMDFPDAYAELGISKQEYEAWGKDPVEYLGKEHIPGTQEYDQHYRISKKIFERFFAESQNKKKKGESSS